MLLTALLLQAAQPVGVGSAPANRAVADSYVLGPNDEIEMTVFGQKDMSLDTRIRADGSIIAPYVGNVQAAGKTTAQLSDMLAAAYSKGGYLNHPSINVEVTEYASKVADVSGWVDKSGLYPLDRPYTVSALVARAGGAREGGANSVILKPADGSADVRINLTDNAASSRLVQPGDRLYVPEAEQVYVYGEVNKGGAFSYRPGMTFRQALAVAGGPTLAGSAKRISVTRNHHDIKVSLDDEMQPEDVLVIREKLF